MREDKRACRLLVSSRESFRHQLEVSRVSTFSLTAIGALRAAVGKYPRPFPEKTKIISPQPNTRGDASSCTHMITLSHTAQLSTALWLRYIGVRCVCRTSKIVPASACKSSPAPRSPLRNAIHRTSAFPPFSLGFMYGTYCSSTVPENTPVVAPCCKERRKQSERARGKGAEKKKDTSEHVPFTVCISTRHLTQVFRGAKIYHVDPPPPRN